MWNLLFITTSLGLCVFVSALYPDNCVNPMIDQTIHPKSACVKPGHCPKLQEDLKEKYSDDFTERLKAISSCGNDDKKICCPHSWINDDCINPIIDQTVHPVSRCVKPERCPKLYTNFKEKYSDHFAERFIALSSCEYDRQNICCPQSWINTDLPVSSEVRNEEKSVEEVYY